MNIGRLTGIIVALLFVTAPVVVMAGEDSHRQAVEKLFELTRMQQKIEESLRNVLALQLTQSPALQEHEAVVHEFLERHIGWQSMQDALTGMYLQEFSEAELNEMNAFYGSETGRKVIERLPVLVQMRNQLASKRLQENIGELQYRIQSAAEESPQAAEETPHQHP